MNDNEIFKIISLVTRMNDISIGIAKICLFGYFKRTKICHFFVITVSIVVIAVVRTTWQ